MNLKPRDLLIFNNRHVFNHEINYTEVNGIMVIVVGTGHSDPSSKPGHDCLHFTLVLYTWKKYASNYSPASYE